MPRRRFNSISKILSFITVFLVLAPGCAHHPLAPGHHIVIDPDGRPKGHVGDEFRTLKVDEYRDRYVQPILDGIEEHLRKNLDRPERKRILIFIHGGLNGYDDGRKHVVDLLSAQELLETHPFLSSYYAVAINWEAGLKSALWDHFFDVRGGFRNRPLAIATSPFVFTSSVGQAILNAPRDAWHAYGKDLWEKQLPSLGVMGLSSGLAAAGYGGIIAGATNLTFISIAPQAVAVAAGIYVGPLLLSDPTYYAFGPVRMLSAPFIDGFGAPAWEMLKRRPDLTLLNPEIYAKEDVKGPAYLLLQAISDKVHIGTRKTLSGESLPGTFWTTKSGESLPVQLTLVGHSMGAMVGDRILQTFSNRLRFDDILYMGAASTIDDFQVSVIPYLQRYPHTRFWAYSLTEEDEAAETLPGDLLMRGSLLEWIDKLLEPPQNLLHYRFGKEKSQEYVVVDDKDVWSRICRITSSGDSKPGVPRKHGDFTDPLALDKALSFVHHGCPTIIDLNTSSREELSHIPYFDQAAINAIVSHREKKPFDDKEELVDAQIIPYDNYACAAEHIAPIEMNSATVTEISRLLRGDRFLAAKVVTLRERNGLRTKDDSESLSGLLKGSLPEHFYREIMGHFTITPDSKHNMCWLSESLPGITKFAFWYDRSVMQGLFFGRSRFRIWNEHNAFQSEVISKLETTKGTTLISKRDEPFEDMSAMEDFWSAVVEFAGKRIGLDIHFRAELGKKGAWADWYKDPDFAKHHRTAITERAKADQLDAVFSIWDKDISKWPGFEENEAEIKRTLGTTTFVQLSGTPERIAEAILKEAQSLP